MAERCISCNRIATYVAPEYFCDEHWLAWWNDGLEPEDHFTLKKDGCPIAIRRFALDANAVEGRKGGTMSVEVQVFLPGEKSPVDVEDYIDYLCLVAGAGTYEQSLSIPGTLVYDNPKTGTKCSIGDAEMRSN
jgi:hypothetical protein